MAGSSHSYEEKVISSPYLSPYDAAQPLDYIIVHNRSKNANLFAGTELKKVWPDLKIIQTVESLDDGLENSDHLLLINEWTNMSHFKEQFDLLAAKHSDLRQAFKAKKVGFYCVWSAAAEDENWARAALAAGFTWIGASPAKMEGLDKINFKKLCKVEGVSTAHFIEILPEEKLNKEEALQQMAKNFMELYAKDAHLSGTPVFAKHSEGGGGRGTAKLTNPTYETALAAFRKIVNETGGNLNGVYVEEALDLEGAQLFQMEIEGDAGTLAYGVRFVYFNAIYQKVLEIAFSKEAALKMIPEDIYNQCRKGAAKIFKASGYDNRGTIEILIIKDRNANWSLKFSELNKRIQVEHATFLGLASDSKGRALNVAAEQVMRSLGYPAPQESEYRKKGPEIVGHVRLISGELIPQGVNIPLDLAIDDAFYPAWADVQFVKGPVNTRNDAQLGRALISANNWEDFCNRLLKFSQSFQFVGPKTDQSTYFDLFRKLASDVDFRAGRLGCNQTMRVMANAPVAKGKFQLISEALASTVTPLVTHGYKASREEAIKNQPYPTVEQIKEYQDFMESLRFEKAPETAFSKWLQHRHHATYIQDFKADLKQHGGGTVNVMRDVFQSGYNQHSFAVQRALVRLIEIWGVRTGFMFGHETGGAQFQAALMHAYNFMDVLLDGCPSNLPSHSLTRSKWLNGLKPKTLEQQRFYLGAIAKKVAEKFDFYPAEGESADFLPWIPYNFHAGNYYPESSQTTRIFLEKNLPVIPSWAWSHRYSAQGFRTWVEKQIELFEEMKKPFNMIRIKNAGQGPLWSAQVIVDMVQEIRKIFAEHQLEEPIIYIHNHEFNGKAAHIAAKALKMCQALDYPYLVVDSAPPGTTHNDNMVIANALKLSPQEKEALMKYNEGAQLILNLASRFNNQALAKALDTRNSEFAGGTTSSDISDAVKNKIPTGQIEALKALAMELTGLGTAVTPYSEWMKQIGYAIYMNDQIQPKTEEAVRAYVQQGGTLAISKLILEGLQAWKTLLPRREFVKQLLLNHKMTPEPEEKEEAKPEPFNIERRKAELQTLLPNTLIDETVLVIAEGFDDIGLAYLKARDQWSLGDGPRDLTLLMSNPEFVLAEQRKVGDAFMLYGERVSISKIHFEQGKAYVDYLVQGHTLRFQGLDPNKQTLALVKQRQMAKDPTREVGAPMTGSLMNFFVKPGDKVKKGEKLFVMEAMKSEVTTAAPDDLEVESITNFEDEKDKKVEGKQLMMTFKKL